MAAMFQNVITTANNLQALCNQLGDNAASSDKSLPSIWSKLPQIVVIGGQSSGKSSVLEAIVGRDFLPRGTGIVTRRPLMIQLVHLDDPNAAEYGEFLHSKNKKYDFAQIMQEIEDETLRLLEKKRLAVSPEPIQLTVYSPNVPNLSLVDMPGLTKVPIDGQPRTIVKELDDMARQYIKNENVIILAVTPANADLATSDALHMAREVDPAGDRTIGVLTKVDIMDPGTDCADVLNGRSVQLKHGWIAVVNRGQKDIVGKMSMDDARRRELEFFNRNPAYTGSKNLGTGFLSNKLSNHLVAAIRKQLPVIQTFVQTSLSDLQKELEVLGGQGLSSRGEMVHLILTLCRKFEEAFIKILDSGKDGGERILQVFDHRMMKNMVKLKFEDMLNRDHVKKAVDEADGYQPHLIAPEAGYRKLLDDCLSLFQDPAQVALDEVYRILRNIVARTMDHEDCRQLKQFTVLQKEIASSASDALDSMREYTKKIVTTLVEMERAYISTDVFREIIAASQANPPEDNGHGETGRGDFLRTLSGRVPNERSGDQIDQIIQHVSAYVAHVRVQLKQTIPKAIVHCLVLQAKKSLLEKLQMNVANMEDNALKRTLVEDETTVARREACVKRISLLKRAETEITNANLGGLS